LRRKEGRRQDEREETGSKKKPETKKVVQKRGARGGLRKKNPCKRTIIQVGLGSIQLTAKRVKGGPTRRGQKEKGRKRTR